MSPSNQSNDRFDLDNFAHSGDCPDASPSELSPPSPTVNARFLSYLEQVYAPRNPRRLGMLTIGIVGAACLAAFAALALVREVHAVWPLFPVGVALVARFAFMVHHRLGTRHRLFRVRDVIESGVPVIGYLVQANSALFRPGVENLPCLALFSFQPEVGSDRTYMRHLAARVYSYKNTQSHTGEGRYLSSLTSDEQAVLYRRRQLPFSLTDGSTIFCADVLVSRAYIKNGYLSGDTLPLLAGPGDGGGVELVPWWLADAQPDAPTSHERGAKIER